MLEKRGLPILHWAIAPWYPVEKTGCACIMSSISFQATHLDPGTGTCELQQQLVHLIATAQTHGEFRNERKRCSSLSEEEKKHALTLLVEKYSPDFRREGGTAIRRSLHRTEVIRIDIETFSGKHKRKFLKR